jgi:hypothetical protein
MRPPRPDLAPDLVASPLCFQLGQLTGNTQVTETCSLVTYQPTKEKEFENTSKDSCKMGEATVFFSYQLNHELILERVKNGSKSCI